MFNLKSISFKLIIATSMLTASPVGATENAYGFPNIGRADRNDDGIISTSERRHARYQYNRIDLNDDGTINHREKHYAQHLRKHADRNHDGHIGPRERMANRRFINRTDQRF